MNDLIAEYYREKIQALEWSDLVGGMVRPISTKKPVANGKTTTLTFPVACDITWEDCENNTDMLRMFTPDSNKGSIVYFEDKGVSQGVYGGKQRFVSTLRLVCWMNLRRFSNSGCSLSFYAISSIKEAIMAPGARNFRSIIQAMITDNIRILPKDKNIFSAYTYNEFKQYLVYPFDYFAIDIETVFDVNPSCVPELIPQDDTCN